MKPGISRGVAPLALLATVTALVVALPTAAHAQEPPPTVRITEWMYNPVLSAGEYIEITNLATAPVSLAGWSFDDDSKAPGTVPLDGLGTLAAGESAIVTESVDATFRSDWGLPAGAKVLAGNTTNLGRADEINLFAGPDAVADLVDRLTYSDQGTGTVKGPRTQGIAGVPSTEAALGANDASQWRLSVVGDAETSRGSTTGDIGSPGSSRFAPTTPPVDSWTQIRINEVSSDNGATPVGDAIELFNSGTTDVSVAGWLQIDGGLASAAAALSARLPDGSATTVVPAHGFVYLASTKGLGSGGDGVKIYLPDGPSGSAGTLVDSVTYTAGQAGADETNGFGAGAYARCPDGSGAFVPVTTKSFGASNATACLTPATDPGVPGGGATLLCQPEAPDPAGALPAGALVPGTWPGSADVAVADKPCAWTTTTGPEGRDISALVVDPSDASVLYSVKNKSWVYRLVKQGGLWIPDTSNGWGAGKQIFFPGNTDTATNQPDAEGLTVGPDGALYVTTERNNAANAIPLNSILRFDPSQSGTTLVATDQWNLTAEFPELHAGSKTEANLGFEGVTFVPDSYLVANGFVDASTGVTYTPSTYPLHGTGLYFAGLENDGKLYAYALNSDRTFHRVAVVDTGMGHVQDVQYDSDAKRIWALCDNTCGVSSTVLKVGSTGTIVPEIAYSRPASLPVNNLEGFALAPSSTCAGGTKEVIWSDDGLWGTGVGTTGEGHALYSGRISCDLGLGGQGVPPGPAPWDRGAVYTGGDTVAYGGKVFRARWFTSGEVPGSSVHGSWEELSTAADGTAIWTPSRVFTTGDVVVHDGTKYSARWWTRNQAPGGVGGPWTEIPAAVPAGSSPAWSVATVYGGGELVTYLGHTYQAQWWTSGVAPTTAGSAWKQVT